MKPIKVRLPKDTVAVKRESLAAVVDDARKAERLWRISRQAAAVATEWRTRCHTMTVVAALWALVALALVVRQ